jgi:hypothetical protein
MNTTIQRRNRIVFFVGSFLLPISFVSVSRAETDKQTEQRMIKESNDAAERAQKREEEKGQSSYEVKKPNDDHIKETERAAARPEKIEKENKSYSLPDPCLKNASLPGC